MHPHLLARILLAAWMLCATGLSWGQNYPVKPVRIITSEPGGNLDAAARVIAPGLASALGQQVIIDNRSGTVIPVEVAAKAPSDGYSLLFNGSGIWLMSFMRDDVSWDPLRDFAPVTLAVSSPNILVVHPSLPVKSVKELIALAKAKPGALNDAGGGAGSSTHIAGELFKAMAGVKIVRIAYRGGGAAVIGLLGGEAQLMFGPAASAAAHMKSGRLRGLAVTSGQPSALFPDLPTVAAAGGMPGYDAVTRVGMFVPAKTPDAIISRLNQDIVRVLGQPDVKEKLTNSGIEPVGSSPAQLLAVVKSEMAGLGKLIKDVGIRAQ